MFNLKLLLLLQQTTYMIEKCQFIQFTKTFEKI